MILIKVIAISFCVSVATSYLLYMTNVCHDNRGFLLLEGKAIFCVATYWYLQIRDFLYIQTVLKETINCVVLSYMKKHG